ncbi:type II toxin-antitoxin system HipA family toxin [Arthrobacter sp. H14]|uniref:type II toxin-antitoxin system HipA family toxin n=1 Tax=Arthrobacter sp. H14 TaxID=1312959 RepID=UPI00047B13C5|nr:HipA domain-containing protein [Arthrobacter sp. H14]
MNVSRAADVYKQGILAARMERHESGTRFSYLTDYGASGKPAVAATLPVSETPIDSASGAVPAFFAGLLPEGRRLNALRKAVKTSADDELSLLLAVGGDPVGDVQIVPQGEAPADAAAAVVLDPKAPVSFAEMLQSTGIDPTSLAGVQDKFSAGMISLPVEQSGRRFILKLNTPEYPRVVENEFLMYSYARKLRIPVSGVKLVHDVAGQPALLVDRFDRVADDDGSLIRLAVEDAAQVLGLYPADKYNISYSAACRALVQHCNAPLPALRNLAIQAAFAWLTGNGDLHAKNISVLQDRFGETVIAPVYDIPSTVAYGDKTLALTLKGKTSGISRKHFLSWTDDVGLPQRAAERCVDTALNATRSLVDDLESGASPFPAQQSRAWIKELKHRRRLIEG